MLNLRIKSYENDYFVVCIFWGFVIETQGDCSVKIWVAYEKSHKPASFAKVRITPVDFEGRPQGADAGEDGTLVIRGLQLNTRYMIEAWVLSGPPGVTVITTGEEPGWICDVYIYVPGDEIIVHPSQLTWVCSGKINIPDVNRDAIQEKRKFNVRLMS